MTAQPAGRAAADRAAGDPTAHVRTPTPAAGRVTAGRVTAREITEFLRHLAELRDGARGDDPAERAAFLARKADLFTRLADDPHADPHPGPTTDNPSTEPEGRTP